MRAAASLSVLIAAASPAAWADVPSSTVRIVHPITSTAGCASSAIAKKVAAAMGAKAGKEADGLMERNHCIAIIGADAQLGPASDDSTLTYRLVEDRGDGVGLFVSELRMKDRQYQGLDTDTAFYAPLAAFRPGP